MVSPYNKVKSMTHTTQLALSTTELSMQPRTDGSGTEQLTRLSSTSSTMMALQTAMSSTSKVVLLRTNSCSPLTSAFQNVPTHTLFFPQLVSTDQPTPFSLPQATSLVFLHQLPWRLSLSLPNKNSTDGSWTSMTLTTMVNSMPLRLFV